MDVLRLERERANRIPSGPLLPLYGRDSAQAVSLKRTARPNLVIWKQFYSPPAQPNLIRGACTCLNFWWEK